MNFEDEYSISKKDKALLRMINMYIKLEYFLEMSVLASKPKFTSSEGNFDRAGWEIQIKVAKLFVKILKFW